MRFTKQDVTAEMIKAGLVPLFTPADAEQAVAVIRACYEAGIRTFEFTNRKDNSLEVFTKVHQSRASMPGLMLGAGTILDKTTAKKFIDAGADFIISPVVKTEMAQVCHDHEVHWIPGAATLTEIVTATDHGAEIIKVFPGSVLGPSFISSIMPVIPGLQLMVTGGVEPTEQNLTSWFKAGAMSVGLGSALFSKDIIDKKDWAALVKNIRHAVTLVRDVRTKLSQQ